MSQAFYRKWRPQTWDEVVSQEHVVQTLRNAVRAGRIGHAYLLAGPRGTGKTTTARLLAKSLNCLAEDPATRPCDTCAHCLAINEGRFLDLVEIDAASNTSVDDVRDLRDKINFRPTQGQYKVYIIDEVHMLSTAAFNALLKTLEEPPPHAIFILATTEVHKIPATVLSRCQRYEFRRIPVTEIARHLKAIAEEEGLQFDEDALLLIARQATGAMRDAISLLDQLASTGQRVTLAEAQVVLGTATSGMVIQLVDAILDRSPALGMQLIHASLDSGADARQFARQVVDYLRNLLLIRLGNAEQVEATPELRSQMAQHAGRFDQTRLLEAIRLFNSAAVDARASWHPGLALELAFAETLEDKAPPAATAQLQPASSQPAAAQPQPAAGQPHPASRPVAEKPSAPPHSAAAFRAAAEPAAPKSEPPARSPVPPARSPEPPADMPPDPFEAPEDPPDIFLESPPSAPPPAAKPQQRQPAPSQPAAGQSQPAAGQSQPATGQSQRAPSQPAAARPAASQPPQPAPPAAAGRAITQQEINQNWKRIREFVKTRNRMAEGLLNSCRFTLKENTLVLSFVGEVVKSKMDTTENMELLRQALQAVMGVPLNVRCVLAGSKTSGADDVSGDSMVGTALDLGGKIVYEE